jgi:hypothetical protein
LQPFYVWMDYNPNWFISSIFLLFTLVPFFNRFKNYEMLLWNHPKNSAVNGGNGLWSSLSPNSHPVFFF